MGAWLSKPSDDPHLRSLTSNPALHPASYPCADGLTHTLSSSRTLGYAIYGAPLAESSHVLISFHGTPGTRFFFHASHAAAAAAAGVAVITPERPGFGLSSPSGARTLLSHAADVAELLDALHVTEVAVLGWSAGGPYALAFVRAFEERVSGAALVSSLSPAVLEGTGDVRVCMSLMSRFGYFAARCAPMWALEWLCRMNGWDEVSGVLKGSKVQFSREENDLYKNDRAAREMFGASTLELSSRPGGAKAEAEDYALFCQDWGFELEELDVSVPVFLLAGEEDDKCTPNMWRCLEGRVPNVSRGSRLVPGKGHLLFFESFPEEPVLIREFFTMNSYTSCEALAYLNLK